MQKWLLYQQKKKNLNHSSPCLDCLQTMFHIKNGLKLFHKKLVIHAEFVPNLLLSYIQTITTDSPKIKKSGNELVELKKV